MEANKNFTQDKSDVDETLLQEMEQRYNDVRSGKMKTIPWEEAEQILLADIENRKVKHA